ncbi:MAG: D-alanine--D-alanine ligase [Desulfobacterales bacterium]|nr:D-alanine--D-alanine ligase [Desulfobacterales bacterium]
MRIAILHNAVSGADAPDEQDVLVQVAAVAEALGRLGHDARPLACTLDLAALRARLVADRPDLAFNLVESLDGTGRLIHLVPTLLDHLRIAFTGAPTEAVLATSHKLMAKERMRALGLPTPAWLGPHPPGMPPACGPAADGREAGARWIVKSLWEHASIGIDEASLELYDGAEAAGAALAQRARELGGACFAERFVDGREFNLSLLAGPTGPEVLRPAEIRFEGYAPEAPRVVGYRAKWDAESYEFHHTPRRFDFPGEDAPLLERLRRLALDCWAGFRLGGYARVDFRVDVGGEPWILEVNANPCLSPDAGFAAALAQTGIDFTQAVERIVGDAMRTK